MYVPPQFGESDPAQLADLMRAFPLATVVTHSPAGLRANHIPILAAGGGPHGTLHFHLARANEQWRDIEAGREILAIFCGPEAYISPSAYATKRETGKVVPTWNYVAVHAYGVGRTFHDEARLHALVSRLTAVHEDPRDGVPWKVDDAPATFIEGQLRGIVGVEMPIARIIGKWKMSQNRSDADRAGATADLNRSQQSGDRLAAEVMESLETRRRTP